MQARGATPGTAIWRALKWLLLPWMAAVTILGFAWAKAPTTGFMEPESARILFWHVPVAELCMAWFFAGAFYAGVYLFGKRRGLAGVDRKSEYANQIGLLLAVLTTITGMVFASRQWGKAWDWDPKQVGITILILVYLAYFGLRMSVTDPEQRGRLSGVYAIIAALLSPVLTFVIPQYIPAVISSHPAGTLTGRGQMDPEWKMIFYAAALGFFGITLWIYQLRLRVADLEEAAELRAERAREVGSLSGQRTEAVRAPAART